MITTGMGFDGYKVTRYYGLVTARTIFSDIALYGDKPKHTETWDGVLNDVSNMLLEKANVIGANAVIGIRSEIFKQGSGALGPTSLVLIGTAVFIEPI